MFDKLDFPVVKADIPHPMLPLVDGKQQMIPGRKAIIRTDTNEVLNIVSNRYPLVPHVDVFEPMEAAITELGLPIIKRREQAAYSGGYAKVTWTLDKTFKVDDHGLDDNLNCRIVARNSYNYSSIVALEFGTMRQICTNGMVIGRVVSSAKKRHVPSLSVPDLIKTITEVLAKTGDVQKRMSQWNQIEYPRDRMMGWLDAQPIAKPARQSIIDYYTMQPDRVKAGGQPVFSGWEAVNAITWFATHGVRTKREDTVMLAEERFLDLAQIFTRQELEGIARGSRN